MVNLLSFTVVIICSLQACYGLETLPVVVVDTGGVSVMGANVGNPFNKITNEIFSEMIKALVAKASLTLIFVESELSVEHFSKTDSQGSPFKAFLQEMIREKKLLYLPAVLDPYSTLTSLLPMSHENTHDIATAKQIAKEFKPDSHVYIKFEPEEPTVERLRLHDLAMRNIVRAAKSITEGPLVAFYTGVQNPLVIEKKKPPIVKKVDEKSVLIASNRVLFRLSVEHEHKGVQDSKPVEAPIVKHELEDLSRHGGDDLLTTTLAFPAGFHLRFDFLLRSKDWILDKITLLESDVEVGHAKIGIGAPLRSSYHCAETLRIINSRDQSAVILKRYQWQPSRESCELTKKGCEDQNIARTKFKLPVGTIQSIENLSKSLNIKDTWGHKYKKPKTKHYDHEALYEADDAHKTHEGAEEGTSDNKQHKKKPGYIVEDDDDDEQKTNEESVLDQKKHSGDKNLDDISDANGEHKSSPNEHNVEYSSSKSHGKHHSDTASGKGHKKQHHIAGENPVSQNDQHLDAEKDLSGQNKHEKDAGKTLFIHKKQHHVAGEKPDGQNNQHPDAEKDAEEDPFGHKNQSHAANDEHKTIKQDGKGQSNNNKGSKNKGSFDSFIDKEDTKHTGIQEDTHRDAPGPNQSLNEQSGQAQSHSKQPVAPSKQPAVPSKQPTVPSKQPVAPSKQPAVPSKEPVAPSKQSAVPSKQPVAPSEQPTGPSKQPTVPSKPTTDLAFGTSVNCGPFFNHEVLSCLLVTFIILAMFFYGLEMMVNLQANDRFDDFGGRTFTIAEEK